MQAKKQIEQDGAGEFIQHGGVKYRPQVASQLSGEVTFTLPPRDSDDSHATVTQGRVTETWTPIA